MECLYFNIPRRVFPGFLPPVLNTTLFQGHPPTHTIDLTLSHMQTRRKTPYTQNQRSTVPKVGFRLAWPVLRMWVLNRIVGRNVRNQNEISHLSAICLNKKHISRIVMQHKKQIKIIEIYFLKRNVLRQSCSVTKCLFVLLWGENLISGIYCEDCIIILSRNLYWVYLSGNIILSIYRNDKVITLKQDITSK